MENRDSNTNWYGKAFSLGCIGLVLMICLILGILAIILVSKPEAPAPTTQVPVTEVTPLPTAGLSATPVAGSTVCRYADGYDSFGKVVSQNTTVIGPAVIKPSRESDHAILLLPGSTYITTAADEVVWALQGDAACVMSQGQFFGSTEVR